MTALIAPGCRQLGQHQIWHYGIPICCLLDYTRDEPADEYLRRRGRGGLMHNPNMPIAEEVC